MRNFICGCGKVKRDVKDEELIGRSGFDKYIKCECERIMRELKPNE